MQSEPSASSDFGRTHHFCSGVFLITIYVGSYKQIDSKKRIVVFEKGTRRGKLVQRLAVYKCRGVKLLSAASEQPSFLMSLNDDELYGLIKGVQRRRVRYSKYVYSPTVTIVTNEATVVLTATESDYERSIRQHDLWYKCLKDKLQFGGYWSVEHETASGQGGSSSVTLCLSKHRLTLLAASPYDHDVFDVEAEYSIASIVCWKLHHDNRQGCRVATLSVTVAPHGNQANFERLLLRIDHNETMSSDISKVLSHMQLPRRQCEVRQQMTPASYLDLQLRQPYEASTRGRRRAPAGNRRSRDDLDLFVEMQPGPVCPPRRLPPRTHAHHHVLNSYDLNALSSTDSVKDAVHFYENIDSVSRPRPRRPPDVVSSHLDEDEEYWSMVFTLREVLRRKKPEPDTLGLIPSHRLLLCFLLLDDSIPSWKNLAEHIGLKQEAVKMIEILFRCDVPCDDVTPTECVLRHWQFVYNKATSPGTASPSTAPPCTRDSLINILDQIGRHDLVVRLSTQRLSAVDSLQA